MKDAVSPSHVFESVGLPLTGSRPWGESIPAAKPGVYVVSLDPNPDVGRGLSNAPIDSSALSAWLLRCPGLTVHNRRPDVSVLAEHLSKWWLSDTSILYIGKAEDQSLHGRVGQYYKTPLGARSPHGGGYWLKTLTVLPQAHVHYAEVPNETRAGLVEDDLINAFLASYLNPPATHPEPELLLPWANLQIDRPAPRRRRKHGLPSLPNQLKPVDGS